MNPEHRQSNSAMIGTPTAMVHVSFGLYGPELDPGVVSQRTALKADVSYRAGDRMLNGRTRKNGLWVISSPHTEAAGFGQDVDRLLGRMRPSWFEFVKFGKHHHAYLDVVVEMTERPTLSLAPGTLAALAELNAELGFDLQVFAPDEFPGR